MRTRPHPTVTLAVLLFFSPLAGCGEAPVQDRLIGSWGVALEETIEAAKRSGELSERELQSLPRMVERMMKRMVLHIEADRLVYEIRGVKREEMPYTQQSSGR